MQYKFFCLCMYPVFLLIIWNFITIAISFPSFFRYNHENCCCCYCLFTAVCYDSWPRNERKIYVFNFLCSFHFHFFHSHSRVLAACLVAFRIGNTKKIVQFAEYIKCAKFNWESWDDIAVYKREFGIGKIGIWLIYLWRIWCLNVWVKIFNDCILLSQHEIYIEEITLHTM